MPKAIKQVVCAQKAQRVDLENSIEESVEHWGGSN